MSWRETHDGERPLTGTEELAQSINALTIGNENGNGCTCLRRSRHFAAGWWRRLRLIFFPTMTIKSLSVRKSDKRSPRTSREFSVRTVTVSNW